MAGGCPRRVASPVPAGWRGEYVRHPRGLLRVLLASAGIFGPPIVILLVGPGRLVGHDIEVFFRESAWAAGGPPLYSKTFSEYPLAANLLFALIRRLGDALQLDPTALGSFTAVWLALGWWCWLGVLVALRRVGRPGAVWLWLTPTSLYFGLLHFDIVPVALTIGGLATARSGRLHRAALLVGLAIAIKGYMLFAVPAFATWILLAHGPRRAVTATAVAIAPLALSVALVALIAGGGAAIAPFRWQALRGLNGESLWDALNLVLGGRASALLASAPGLPFGLAALASLLAAAVRPRTFDDLCRSVVIAVGGYALVSVFYSAQFALWLIPPIALGGGRLLLATGIVFQWATFAYAPVGTHLPKAGAAVARLTFLGLAALRVALPVVAVLDRWPRRGPSAIPGTVRG